MLLPTLKFLKLTMSNPLSRYVMRYGSSFCEEGETSRFEHALMIYLGLEHPRSWSCKAYSFVIATFLDTATIAFGVNKEDLKKFFADPVTRRGLTSVIRGISKYGVTKPQYLDAPFLVVWDFTNACNLDCRHCYQHAGDPTTDELKREEKLQVVRELAEAGVVSIAFSGGEPLMSRDFYEVAGEVKRLGMYVALATNGTLINEEVAARLKDRVDYVEVSLDFATAEEHDAFRGMSEAFDRAVAGIRNTIKAGIFTCVATTVTQANLDQITEIIELARKLQAKRFIAFNFIPTGRGKEIVKTDLTAEQRENLLKTLVKENEFGEIEVLSTAPQFARVSLELSQGEVVAPTHFYVGRASWDLQLLAEFIGGCGAGRLYCALQPNGDVAPCVFMPNLVVGSIREKRFSDIWTESELLRKLRNRDLLHENCGNCKYRYVCGGCRARALAYLGDVLAPDPGCIRNANTGFMS